MAWLLPMGAAAILLVLWATLRKRASLLVTSLVMTCTFLAMSNSFSLRPHLVTFALTIVVTNAWLDTAKDLKPRWWLILLSWVWACSHGMWFVGPMIGCAALLGMLFDRVTTFRDCWRLASIPVASVLAAAVTPVGPALLMSPLEVRGFTQFIEEWRPPSLGDIGFVAFLVLVAACLLPWLRSLHKAPWTDILLLTLATGLALAYVRTVPVGAAIVAPMTAAVLQRASGLPREAQSRQEVSLTVGLVVLGLSVAAVLSPARASLPQGGANNLNTPLDSLPSGTVLCNEYALGGWLIWRHPQLKPAIDGRTEVYSLDTFTSYIDFQKGGRGWESYPQRTGCTYALLGVALPPAQGLVKQEGWKVVARSADYVLLSAPTQR
ncbi:hypothetical protein [Humibacillus xanthopallidus]|uniref:hypothetical protein n=1 Tax=Humibacillus xanthopallidus TaxID=412689 RepID=UPI00114F6DDF